MKKSINNKKDIILIIVAFVIIGIASMIHFQNLYSESNWLQYYNDTSYLEKISCFSFWWYISTTEYLGYSMYLFPIVLVFISCKRFFQIYRSGFLYYLCNYASYKKTLLLEIIKSWRFSLILPIISLCLLLISRLLYSNTIIATYNPTEWVDFISIPATLGNSNSMLFVFIYFIILIFYGIIIINIGLCVLYFVKKKFAIPIISYMILLLIENINNYIIAPVISNLFKIPKLMNSFSIFNLYYLNSIYSLKFELLFSLTVVGITSIAVYFIYRNKERVLIKYE